ncbi:Rho family protein [Ascoidea rubescens DSM 1968]|uniref:GTP-binding protein RHO4 n=1 Tax=Ascoidea rubescens DSM 1968 TaxID=1344418 RepID=A0A1D2VCQ9_9ASCO|nr:ras-like GTP-binding protein Rho1 [Ascoidea rubescens DSM 1968]ODV59300.1 ras-like GTP-binding protein Rho1 [Ascoidea rubescens DSM 1968]
MQIDKKLVIVGDGFCGKTCLLTTFVEGKFPKEYIPTVFEESSKIIQVEQNDRTYEINLSLWDTAGQEDFDRLRPLAYPDSDVILLCFSIDSDDTLRNASERWFVEIRQHVSQVPIILVGCKKDVRESGSDLPPSSFVSSEQGANVARQLGAVAYLECSALTNSGVQQVFQTAAAVTLGSFNQNQPNPNYTNTNNNNANNAQRTEDSDLGCCGGCTIS